MASQTPETQPKNDPEKAAVPEENKSCFSKTLLLARKCAIPIFLLSGSFAVVISKVTMTYKAEGIHGSKPHDFAKPWFMDWAMFAGMTLCLFMYTTERLITRGVGMQKAPLKLYWIIAIPALLDTVSTFMMNVGLLWVSSSVWQMLRGSIIVFTAILKITYRKSRLHVHEWIGMLIVLIALMVVGGSAFKTPHGPGEDSSSSSLGENITDFYFREPVGAKFNSTTKMIVGIALVILAQFMQALQTIIEEKLLHDVQAPATLIVGMEGVWGLLFCSFISMPIASALPGAEGDGLYENTLDSFVMMYNNPAILGLVLGYVVVVLLFNLYGMIITEVTNAMLRNLLEPIRTLFIWVFMVFIHYVISRHFGERINFWSLLQLGGFAILCVGFLIYNSVIKLPCCPPPPPEKKVEEDKKTKTEETKPLLNVQSSQ
jgi:hypothetical protein